MGACKVIGAQMCFSISVWISAANADTLVDIHALACHWEVWGQALGQAHFCFPSDSDWKFPPASGLVGCASVHYLISPPVKPISKASAAIKTLDSKAQTLSLSIAPFFISPRHLRLKSHFKARSKPFLSFYSQQDGLLIWQDKSWCSHQFACITCSRAGCIFHALLHIFAVLHKSWHTHTYTRTQTGSRSQQSFCDRRGSSVFFFLSAV